MFRVRRRTAVTLAITGAVLLGGGITAAVQAPGGPAQDASYVSGSTSALYYPAGHRKPAPGFTGTTLAGGTLRFSSYRAGRVVVLNFWGSWCVPCREEAPALAAIAAKYKAAGVTFLGADEQDSPASALAFENSLRVPYPSVNDAGAQVAQVFSRVVPFSAVPDTLVIDPAGKIAGAVFGRASYSVLSTILSQVTGAEPG
jgi:thiol-disulfide isomerase/thioredoxin